MQPQADYGDRIHAIYDALYATHDEAAIEVLAELAGDGPALELGIGTGRMALPLQRRGVEVHGIDASEAMVKELRAKPGGEAIPVAIGDFADVPAEGAFALIYVVFNTFYALLTQAEQIRCLSNAARRLRPGGVFVVEAFVPDLRRFVDRQALRVVSLAADKVQLDATQHDPVNQRVTSQHIFLTDGGVRLYPVTLRYIWPSELDLMARLAGLTLRHRWGDWDRRPFTAESGRHVSVFELA